jgi:hypothetical protein
MSEITPEEGFESPVEATEPVKATKSPVKAPEGFIVALEGDNYQTIADRLGKGYSPESVQEANLFQAIYPGALVKVK